MYEPNLPKEMQNLNIGLVYIYQSYIWANYNDLTATEPWNHG